MVMDVIFMKILNGIIVLVSLITTKDIWDQLTKIVAIAYCRPRPLPTLQQSQLLLRALPRFQLILQYQLIRHNFV